MRSIILLIAISVVGCTSASVLRGIRDLGACDKCNVPEAEGGCKCDSQCACITEQDVCSKCNLPESQGGCKCDNNCACLSSSSPCDKCNLPVDQGGCKCDSNCNCLAEPQAPPTTPPEDLHGLPRQPLVECAGTTCQCGSGGFSYQITEYRGIGGHTDAKVHGCGGGILFGGG